MKKYQYITSLLATLGMCGVMGYAPEAWGQDAGDESDETLPPLVMIVIDTSNSMEASFETGSYTFPAPEKKQRYGKGYSRLTKALAEIAGGPRTTPRVTYQSMYLPRAYMDCTSGTCKHSFFCKYLRGGNSSGSNSTNYSYVAELPNNFRATTVDECEKHDYANDYYNDGVIHSYLQTVKFGFAGMCTSTTYRYGKSTGSSGNWVYGLTSINDSYKSSGYGIYTANQEAPAPTLYPTISDDVNDIQRFNEGVVTTLRSYYADSGTPIGPILSDLEYMFNAPDPGLVKQMKDGVLVEDEKYACRKKAVILISDGNPEGYGITNNDSVRGQGYDVWKDAERLFNSKENVRVYTIVYAQASGTVNLKSGIGKTMNMVAWKGGTCRDKHGDEIKPNDQTAYDNLVNEGRSCMFNAAENNALRDALITVLSDMLEGTKSKTAIATTTAIGQKMNYDSVKKTWNNGYYNIYSGYNVTMGPVRDAVLQRTAIICDHTTGQFSVDDKQYIDMSKRLKCRIRGKDICGGIENTGYAKAPEACLTKDKNYFTDGNNTPEDVQATRNDCLSERYLFTANYVDVDSNDIPRYAISTFDSSPKILKNININDGSFAKAGVIKKAMNGVDSEAEDTASDVNFLMRNNTASGIDSCEQQMTKLYSDQVGVPNYILSPYECKTDFDCGTIGEDKKPRYCDIGRCVDPGPFTAEQGCIENTSAALSAGKVCVGKYWRKIYKDTDKSDEVDESCTTHANCSVGNVCHAGRCIPGTVKGCDIRQFMASSPLGTIEYATPTPVAPPTKAYKSASYRKFSTRYWKRDSMLMVAANDGMLHAFVLGDNKDARDYKTKLYNFEEGLDIDNSVNLAGHSSVSEEDHEGDELWAFIPKTAYKNLYLLQNFGDQQFLNSRPVVADVQLPGFSIDDDEWRTVLVGGFRNGGRGYYAMDITNPAKPFVLWEIDHQWQPWKSDLKYPSVYEESDVSISVAIQNRTNLKNETGYPFQLMGYSYAEPVITNMLIDGQVQPVAILAGGHSASENVEFDMVGRALYIVKLFPKSKEDLLVKTFYFDEAITGTPEVYPNNFNSIAQHIYVGDAKGALYRLTVSSDFNSSKKYEDKSSWSSYHVDGSYAVYDKLNMAEKAGESKIDHDYKHEKPIFNPGKMTGFASGNYTSITFKPAVSLLTYLGEKHQPAIQITFGTGSNDNFNVQGTEKHYIASFVDVPQDNGFYQLNLPGAPCFEPKVILFNAESSGSVGTHEDSNYGEQKYTIYKTDPVNKAKIETHQKLTGAPITHNYVSYFPTFVANSDADNQCVSGHANIWKLNGRTSCSNIKDYNKPNEMVQNPVSNDVFTDSSVVSLQTGTRVYGLEITNQMYCIADCDPADSECKGNNVLAPQLIAQTGAKTAIFASDEGSRKLASGKLDISTLAINLEVVRPEVQRVTWAGVYE